MAGLFNNKEFLHVTTATLTSFFGWCLLINLGFYIVTALSLVFLKGVVRNVNHRLFGIGEERIMQESFAFLGRFKLAIILFFLTPYIALRLMA
jgi:hypothetical protein